MIAITTSKVLLIDETIKVMIENKGFWVRIKENGNCFDSKNIRVPNLGTEDHSNNSWSIDSDSEDNVTPMNEMGVSTEDNTNDWSCPDVGIGLLVNDTSNGIITDKEDMVLAGTNQNLQITEYGGILAGYNGTNNAPGSLEVPNEPLSLSQLSNNTNFNKNSSETDKVKSDYWFWREQNEERSEESNASDRQGLESDSSNPLAIECITNFPQSSPIVSKLQEKLSKIKLGRNRGRPRKITRISNFFDFAPSNKKGVHRKGNLKDKIRTDVAKSKGQAHNYNKGEGKNKQVLGQKEFTCRETINTTRDTESSKMAELVYRTSQDMGLVLACNKEVTMQLIKENLEDDSQDKNKVHELY